MMHHVSRVPTATSPSSGGYRRSRCAVRASAPRSRALPVELALGSRGQTGDEQRRAGGGDDSEGAHLFLPVVVSVVVFVAPLAGPAQPDVAVECLHVEPRAPRAE